MDVCLCVCLFVCPSHDYDHTPLPMFMQLGINVRVFCRSARRARSTVQCTTSCLERMLERTSGEHLHSRQTTAHTQLASAAPWHVVVTSHSRKQVQCRAAGSDLRYLVSEWFVVALFIATDSNIPMHLSGPTKCWYHDLQSIVEVRRFIWGELVWGQISKWKDRL